MSGRSGASGGGNAWRKVKASALGPSARSLCASFGAVADPDLYARDPKRFAALTAEQIQQVLAAYPDYPRRRALIDRLESDPRVLAAADAPWRRARRWP